MQDEHHPSGAPCAGGSRPRRSAARAATLALAVATAAAGLQTDGAWGQPVTAGQRATAQAVAERGVPLAELAPGAPATYTVRPGDTLWDIAGLYLRRPWRWPELWGMNLQAVANPHRIFPGQTLYLEHAGERAWLRAGPARDDGGLPTVRLSPHVRSENLPSEALPTLKPHLIEPFLAEPLVVDDQTLEQAPRLIAARDGRAILGGGDHGYVRGAPGHPVELPAGAAREYRVFRDAVPLIDPVTRQVLGYEARYVGQATLLRGEEPAPQAAGQAPWLPATVQIGRIRQEVRVGDRLLPAPERSFAHYAPHAPQQAVAAAVVSLYGGDTARLAAQGSVIAINRGADDGMQPGHVLQLLAPGRSIVDRTDPGRATVQLPSEPNGLAMVFRTFERVSYALVLSAQQPVRVGDPLVNP
ncbi:LysM domain-containing protein [Melaminivora sp.]|uniref:LysM peptidoglycan-binding domain-containing protein n=1 Tax=Melaminivora sp. TaxID=1933032 RepID=UPI0028B1C359|nr:LysM domain-containing protein [Melaminivora sp.]